MKSPDSMLSSFHQASFLNSMLSKNNNVLLQKKLTELLPLFLNEDDQRLPYLDRKNVYLLFKDYLYVKESPSSILPNKMMDSYSGYEESIGNLTFQKEMQLSIKMEKQILLFENEFKRLFVMKRFCIHIDFSNQTKDDEEGLEKLKKVDEFIEQMYKEYHLVKIFSGCIHSANPKAFFIVHLPSINFLVTELFLEYAGNELRLEFPINDPSTAIFYFTQMAKIIYYLEIFRISQNDLKPENFVVEKLPHFNLIKLIDFDIGAYEIDNLTYKTHKNYKLRGFTPGCVSPEILNVFNKNKGEIQNINIWKSQIYSFGVVMLELVGFFKSKIDFDEFDHYKESEQEYQKFTQIFLKFYNSQKNIYMQNVLKIVQFCISYNPFERLYARDILQLLNNIEKKTEKQIDLEYNDIMIRRNKITKNYSGIGNAELEDEFEKYKLDTEIQINKLYSKIDYLTRNINTYKDKASTSSDKYKFVNLQHERLKEKYAILEDSNKKMNDEKIQKEFEIKFLKEELDQTKNKLDARFIKGSNTEEDTPSELKIDYNLISQTKYEETKKLNKKKKKKKKKIEQSKNEEKNRENNKDFFNRTTFKEIDFNYKSTVNANEFFKQIEIEYGEDIEYINKNLDSILRNFKKLREALIQISFKISNFKGKDDLIQNEIQTWGKNDKINKNISHEKSKYEERESVLTRKILGDETGFGSIINKESKFNITTSPPLAEKNSEFGIICMKNGNILVGLLKNIEFSGVGLIYNNFDTLDGKEYYLGEFKNQTCHGFGQKINKNGEKLIGQFQKGEFIKIEEKNESFLNRNTSTFNDLESQAKLLVNKEKTSFHNEIEKLYNESRMYWESLYKKLQKSAKEVDEVRLYKYKDVTFPNGDKYQGFFKDNKYHGRGKYLKTTGSFYEGSWCYGKMNGFGKYVFRNGDYYIGEYKEGIIEGKGKYDWVGKKCYEGDFKLGKKDGIGKEVYEDKSYYIGYWKNNLEHGKGLFSDSSGDFFEGEYRDGLFNGMGKYKWRTGRYYIGNFVEGHSNGKGIEVCPDGSYYEGNFTNDQYNGYGIYVSADKKMYAGEFKDGYFQGKKF